MMTLDQIMPTLPQMAPQGMFAGGGKLQNALMAAAAGFLSRRQPGMAQSLMQPLLLRQQRAFDEAQQQRQSDLELQRQKDLYQYELQNPKPVNNDTENDYAFWKQTLPPDQFQQWLENKINPPQLMQLPGGQIVSVPRVSSAPPTAPVGKLTPLGAGGQTATPSGGFPY